MILNASGVVLWRRGVGEYDRLAVLYTDDLGKITVRFGGVEKPAAKLKAISEPMTWAEYRLHLSHRTEFGKVVGGRITDSFPAIRQDLGRTVSALACCELLRALTPDRSPSLEKYALITGALSALETGPAPWLVAAFGVQLLDLAGFRLDDGAVPPEDRAAWVALHETSLADLSGIPWREEREYRLRALVYEQAERQLGRGLKSRGYAARLKIKEEALAA